MIAVIRRSIGKKLSHAAKNQQGQTLIFFMLIMVVAALIIPVTLSLMSTSIKAGHQKAQRTSELYAADCQATDALVWLKGADDLQLTDLKNNHKLGVQNGQYLYPDVQSVNGMQTFTFMNYYGKWNSEVVFTITSIAGVDVIAQENQPEGTKYTTVVSYVSWTNTAIFDNAITSFDGNITLMSIVTIQGNVVANGDIKLTSLSKIKGNASATGGISVDPSSSVTGTQKSGATLSFPTIHTSNYLAQSQAGKGGKLDQASNYVGTNITYTGDLHLQGDLSLVSAKKLTVNGNLYVEGSVTVSSTSSLTVNGALYVGGNLSVSSASSLNLGGTTYVNGSMTLDSAINFSGDYPVVANGKMKFNSSVSIKIPEGSYPPLFFSAYNSTREDDWAIDVSSSVTLTGYLYAPTGAIRLNSAVQLTGAVAGKNVSATGSVGDTYVTPPASGGFPGEDASTGIQTISWNISTEVVPN